MSPAVELVESDAQAALLEPFDEQTTFDVAAGRRVAFALHTAPDGVLAGSAVLGDGSLDLHIRPELRARGLGASAVEQLLARADGPLTAWSHEDHPAARALADRFGFERVRTLLLMRLGDLRGVETPAAAASPPAGAAIGAFRPGADDAEWLALNARVFAWHPEQGETTESDLRQRMAEPWFEPADFLIAHDDHGAMIGYNWLKIEPEQRDPGERSGEIYVIGVAPESAGLGLGRALMTAGLARLRERGCTAAELYVEGDNERGIRLYRSLGFEDAAVHVQYARGAV